METVDHVWDMGAPESLRAIAAMLQQAHDRHGPRAVWDLTKELAERWRGQTLPDVVIWEQGDIGDPVALPAKRALRELAIISRGEPNPLPCSGITSAWGWFDSADRTNDLPEFVEHLIDAGESYVASLLIDAADVLAYADWDNDGEAEDDWDDEDEED